MPSQITLCTLNCMLLPLPGFQQRAREAVTWLLEHARRADVLVLTEVFSVVAAHIVIAGLQGHWRHMLRPLGNNLGTDGGVLIASRWPISQTFAMRFTDAVGMDRLAAKGVVAAVIHKPHASPVVVAGTHMQAGTDDVTSAVRAKQWRHVQWFMQSYLQAAARGLPRFLAGDFNEDMLRSSRPQALRFRAVQPPPRDGFSFDLEANPLAAQRAEDGDYTATLDGILVDQTTPHRHVACARIVYPRTKRGQPFTDHEALVAVIASEKVAAAGQRVQGDGHDARKVPSPCCGGGGLAHQPCTMDKPSGHMGTGS